MHMVGEQVLEGRWEGKVTLEVTGKMGWNNGNGLKWTTRAFKFFFNLLVLGLVPLLVYL